MDNGNSSSSTEELPGQADLAGSEEAELRGPE